MLQGARQYKFWVTEVKAIVDYERFRRVLLRLAKKPSDDELTEAYLDEMVPILTNDPVPRLELWLHNNDTVKIITKKPIILKKFKPLYDKLRVRYDEHTAKLRAVSISWARFIEEEYGPSNLGVVSKVKKAKTDVRRFKLSELHPLFRGWLKTLVDMS